MDFYKAKKQAQQDINTMLKNGDKPLAAIKYKISMTYGFGDNFVLKHINHLVVLNIAKHDLKTDIVSLVRGVEK